VQRGVAALWAADACAEWTNQDRGIAIVAANKADFACRLDLSATLTGNGRSRRILPVAHGACLGD
jgi:hypothetical protein